MVDHERPGTIDMRKVNLSADDKNALGNYKALEASSSAGKSAKVEKKDVDITNVSRSELYSFTATGVFRP